MTVVNYEVRKHGFYLGLYLIVLGVVLRLTELDRNGSVLWLFYAGGPVASILLFRALSTKSSLTYWRALLMALMCGLIGASLYAGYVYISNGLVDGSFLDFVRAQNVRQIRESGVDGATARKQIDQLDFLLNPPIFAAVVWIRLQVVYALLSALIAVFYRKKLSSPIKQTADQA